MSTFHFVIEQTASAMQPSGVLRDATVAADWNSATYTKNHIALLNLMVLAQTLAHAVPYGTPNTYRLVIGETCIDSTDPDYRATSHAYPYMTLDGVNKVLAQFDATIPAPEKKHGHK